MTILTERVYGGEFLISEAERFRSRDEILVAASQTLKAGTLIAIVPQGAATVGAATAIGTNAGNGAFGTITADAGAPDGQYNVQIVGAESDAGRFVVYKPDGTEDGHGAVGAAYNGSINFTLADGSNDFKPGDGFTIAVSHAAVAQAKAWNPSGTDGTQVVSGISFDECVTGAGETKKAVAIVRDAQVDAALLDFGAADAGQKATATAALAALGIITRA